MIRRLCLERSHQDVITAGAQSAFPNECCGLLVGYEDADGWCVTEIRESPNVTEGDPKTRFEIDPRVLLSTQRTLRGTKSGIIGVYHSHPNGLAAPSQTDRAHAWQPGWLWIIVGVAMGEDAVMRAFLHASNNEEGLAVFEEVSIRSA